MTGPLSRYILLRSGLLAIGVWLGWAVAVGIGVLTGPWSSALALAAAVLPVILAWRLARSYEKRLVQTLKSIPRFEKDPTEVSLSEIQLRDPQSGLSRTLAALVRSLEEVSFQRKTENAAFMAALDGIGNGLVISDANGLIQFLSPEACMFWEVADDWKSQRLRAESLFHSRESVYDSWSAAVKGGVFTQEQHESGDGMDALLVVHVPLQSSVSPSLWLTAMLDVSEVAVTRHTRREFVGNLSHELRNSLAKLKANAEVALVAEEELDRKKYLDRMLLAVSELNSMQQGLMHLYLLETGLEPIQKQVTTLHSLLQSIHESLSAEVESNGLVLQMGKAPPVNVLLDRHKITQVLTNLVQNAIKHTPTKGEISLSAEVQPLPLQEAGFRGGLPRVLSQEERQLLLKDPVVIIKVRDTGVGIPGPLIPSAFDRLRQLDQNSAQSGIGLGLSLARFTMRAHRGLIWAVNNQPGPGITFSISLPLALTDEEEA